MNASLLDEKSGNIYDDVHPELDQRIFKGDIPRPLIVSFIKRKIFSCLRDSFVDEPEKYFNLYLTGSLTTYQYSDASDCDISIFPDYDSLVQIVEEDDPQEIRKMLIYIVTTELDGLDLPGTPHPLQDFIQPPGLTPQDIFKPGERSAWDFQSHTWIVPPEKERSHNVMTEMPDMFQKAQATAEKMTIVLDNGDVEGAKELYKQIHEQRTKDEKAGLGDFSQGNLNYKWLLHEGLFERLNNEAGMHLSSVWKEAKGSEDTEPTGASVGFLHKPHDTLYPPLFDGLKMRPEAAQVLKSHVLDAIAEELPNPDKFIYFTVYGSGISYNWDELGDIDIQMWVDISKYDGDKPMEQDELVAEVRRLLAPVNFTAIKDLDIDLHGEVGTTLVQYYAKPGTGSEEENLASKPYACYDLEKMEWLVEPSKIMPSFYGDNFLHLLPEANSLANEAESLMDDFERHILEWEFWTGLDEEEKGTGYETRLKQLQQKAEDEQAGIKRFFDRVFQGRADAYSPSGKGVEDERDMLQKLLEVWGIFQRLKMDARKSLPWNEDKESHWKEASEDEPEKMKVIYNFDNDEIMLGTTGKEHSDSSTIIGEYDGKNVKLFDVAKQWVNANYFKRLWVNSFPTRKIDKIYFDKTEIPTRPADQMTYTQKLPHLTAGDTYHDGSKWKHYLKNRGFIVDFKIADGTVLEGKIIDWSADTLKVEIKDGGERTFDDDFMKQIKFKILDKRTLSAFKHAVAVDPEYYKNQRLPFSGCFGFINGHLMLGNSHHQAIMGNLIDAGWTWEQLFAAPQAWGWFGIRHGSNPTITLTFASDSGTQTEVNGAVKAFQKLYKLPVQLDQFHEEPTGVSGLSDYGTGMSGTKPDEGYKEYDLYGDVPGPPKQSSLLKKSVKWEPDHWQEEGLPSDGCFGYVNGHLILGKSHHQLIMARLINAGWTWEQLFEAEQAWGWYSLQPISYSKHLFPNIPEYMNDSYYVSVMISSDAGIQNDEAIQGALGAFASLYHLPVRRDPSYNKGINPETKEYGSGLHGLQNADKYLKNPGTYFKNLQKHIFKNIPQPPDQEWDPDWEQKAEELNPPEPVEPIKPTPPSEGNLNGTYVDVASGTVKFTWENGTLTWIENSYSPEQAGTTMAYPETSLKSVVNNGIYKKETSEWPEEIPKWSSAKHLYKKADGSYLVTFADGSSFDYDPTKGFNGGIGETYHPDTNPHPYNLINLEKLAVWKESYTPGGKTKGWGDIMEKANYIRSQGGVKILRNDPTRVAGTVMSATTPGQVYNTEIWRDLNTQTGQPNQESITMWDCTCPWDQYAWGRTRGWKKYEGRCCAHTLALYWESLGDVPQGAGGTPTAPPTPVPGGGVTVNQGLIQPVGQPPLPTVPLTGEPGPPAPIGPTPSPTPAWSEVVQPGKEEGSITFPGTFSHWKEASSENLPPICNGFYLDGGKMLLTNGGHFDALPKQWKDPEFKKSIRSAISYDDNTGELHISNLGLAPEGGWVRTQELSPNEINDIQNELRSRGYNPLSVKTASAPVEPPNYRKKDKPNEACGVCKMFYKGNCWGYGNTPVGEDMVCDSFAPDTKEGSWKEAAFQNGDIVRVWETTEGMAQPAYGQPGYPVVIKKNQSGEVIYSDEDSTIAIFPLKTGPLEHHLVKVECPTANLYIDNTNAQPFVKKH